MAFPRQIETWHLTLALVLSGTALLLIVLVAREIFYAVNPDKRPFKRKRRK